MITKGILRVCVYLMSYYSQYMENIRIMAESVVLSIEIPMTISGKNYTVGHDTDIFHILTVVGHEVYTHP